MNDEPVRIGLASVVPRHITAPPQWIGGWSGCICARTAEWMPSAPIRSVPCLLGPAAVGTLDQRGDRAVGIVAVAGHPVAEPHRARAGPLEQRLVEQAMQLAAMHGVLRPNVARQPARAVRSRCRCR